MSVEPLKPRETKPTRAQAENAVDTLLRYIGENPARGGLKETPERYVRALEEFCAGYALDPAGELSKTFDDIEGYDDMVVVRDISFVSLCEHHMAPIIGKAHVAYWPDKKVVGISKLARVVDIFARRLTSQETMSRLIAETIHDTLEAKGAAVMIEADHQCMSTSGVNKPGAATITSHFTGCFREDGEIRGRFLK